MLLQVLKWPRFKCLAQIPCRSQPAGDESKNAAGHQVPRVIVDVDRDGATIRQVRSYRGGVVRYLPGVRVKRLLP
jgi:hypothetical protein